jgi:hypothetical protein
VPLDVNDGTVLTEVVVVENVCPVAVIPFKVYNPLLPHVALPYASEVNTAFGVIVPPVTLNVFVTSEVDVKVPVFNEVDEIFPDDVNDVVVIAPAAKPPLPSRLTIVFDVLVEVAEFTADDTVVIVDDKTPPTLFTVVTPVFVIATSPVIKTSAAIPLLFPTIILSVPKGAPIAEAPTTTSSILVTLPFASTVIFGINALFPYVFEITPVFDRVVTKFKFEVPSKLPVDVISPVVSIVLAVVNPLAVPLKVPVKLVEVTEFNPVTFVNVPPKLIVVDPKVIALLASCVLSIPAVADKLADVIPVADIVPPNIDIPEPAPAVKAPCFASKIA